MTSFRRWLEKLSSCRKESQRAVVNPSRLEAPRAAAARMELLDWLIVLTLLACIFF
eukprot:COSAG06_NODE_47500_length_338_cov_3.364017_1_plen_55_part_10